MNECIGYKLFRKRADGSLGPLFINRSQVIEVGTRLTAESHPTKGFAVRNGWHACLKPEAPHLKTNLKSGEVRVWARVKLEDCKVYARPESQGGTWILAQALTVIEVIN